MVWSQLKIALPQQVKNRTTSRPNNSLLDIKLTRTGNKFKQKCVNECLRQPIHCRQNVEIIQMSSIGKWVNKIVYPFSGVLFSHKKGVEVLINATTWMNLENILLSEWRSQVNDSNIILMDS